MRGTHWGQGYNRPTGCSAEKAPHVTFKPWHEMGVRGQLHGPTALYPATAVLVPPEYKARWGPQPSVDVLK